MGIPFWRFRLEDPKTGRHQIFADEQLLIEHVIQWTASLTNDDTPGH
jgi:hypothetical protein